MKNLLQFFLCLIIVLKTSGADEVIYRRVGERAVLNSPGLPQQYYVSWFFERGPEIEIADVSYFGRKHVNPVSGEIWTSRLSISSNSLIINNMQEENFGTIVCKVKDGTNLYATVKFHLIKVMVSMEEQRPFLIPGHRLSLNCNAETKRRPSVYWIKPTGNKASPIQGSVTKKAESQDNGNWECVVKDNGKENKFEFFVSVVDFSSASKYVYTSTNLPLSIPFWITPKEFVQKILSNVQTIEWLFTPKTSSNQQTIFSFSSKDGQLKQENTARELSYKNFTDGGNFSLHRNLARVEDRGTYNCSITFTNGYVLSRSLVVDVLEITPSPGTELISGHHLNLSCSTGGPLETGVTVKWVPPDTSSLAKADFLSGHLIITRVGTEDSGKWRCDLRRNTTTLTSAVITLKIDPILTVWMIVTICAAGIILILLLILAFILFRRRQRKMRQLRHRLCKCKNPKPKGFYKA
ncbi:CD4-1 molecule [Xiphophorus hellerii]|uniref:CD4-1 molecule n=1 Tax=Xiphophorus hellerii TaxID=8084 RepID=UPI0013B3E0B1|nr:T-cell surface glycoprotein CD4-like [Xiphophorus hellerii]XP_032415380.1 T-cell surface glycoprotein CD4-like [Xiphophorus hellerii]